MWGDIVNFKEEGRGEKEKEETGNSSRYPLSSTNTRGRGGVWGKGKKEAGSEQGLRAGHVPQIAPPTHGLPLQDREG